MESRNIDKLTHTAWLGVWIGLAIIANATSALAADQRHHSSQTSPSNSKTAEIRAAQVTLNNAAGEKIGTGTLLEIKDGVRMSLRVQKLSPGKHGVHFHENGKCEGPDFKSAGGHFNPEGKSHGLKNPKGHHAGDLPNMTVENNGEAKYEAIAKGVNLKKDDPKSLLKSGGTSIVIHEKEDDLVSDPAGNSGSRIACGVIEPAQPAKSD